MLKKISFEVDGHRLAGVVFYPEKLKEKNPAILFVQGWTGNMVRSFQYAESLSKMGFICMLFDNKGHGESEGDIKVFTIREFLEGVIAAYDYLLKIEGVDKESVNVVGSSFGGYLVALLSEKRKVNNFVLRVPVDYPNTDFDKSKFIRSGTESPVIFAWRKLYKKPDETFALKAINKFNGEILIIESEQDDIVPHETIENYIDAIKDKSKLTHVLMKGAPHSIKPGKFRDEVTMILVDWFKTKI